MGPLGPRRWWTAEELIAGHKQIIERAHTHGLKGNWLHADALRRRLLRQRKWGGRPRGAQHVDPDQRGLRCRGRFRAATHDPANPKRFLPTYDPGDHLHPNDAGYQAMANAVDLSIFRRQADRREAGQARERANPEARRLRALAKINLDLRVLGKRPDGFHELRTIFQTISLADTIDIAFTPGRKTSIEVEDGLGIPDNLAARAARVALEAMGVTGRVEMRIRKRIPMGAGLGGGSSDAAAVLLALAVLAGREVELPELCAMAEQLGSDVPFFLLGGRAVGIGRGSELFRCRRARGRGPAGGPPRCMFDGRGVPSG